MVKLFSMATHYYIVGLGNPEPEYALTRHNAGKFMAGLFAQKAGGPKRVKSFCRSAL